MIPMFVQMLAASGGGSFLNQDVNGSTFNFSHLEVGIDATSGVRIANVDFDIDENKQFAYTRVEDWLNAGGTASNYEVKFTYVTGSPSGGATAGVWHTLSTNRETWITTSGVGTVTAEVTVDIRRIANTADAIQFTVNLEAERA